MSNLWILGLMYMFYVNAKDTIEAHGFFGGMLRIMGFFVLYALMLIGFYYLVADTFIGRAFIGMFDGLVYVIFEKQ